MTISHFFSSKYLFDPKPSAESKLYLALMIVFGVALMITVGVNFVKKWDAELRSRLFYNFLTVTILGWLYVFARYERLAWLGSRFFLVLVGLIFIVWSIINLRWLKQFKAKLMTKKVLADRYEKYLPKGKK